MAVKAALDLADQILHDPLRTHLRGVFSELQSPTYFPKFGDKHCCTGDVIVVENQFLELAMHLFTPGEGFASRFEQDPVIKLHVSDLPQRSMHFTRGVQIIFTGTLVKNEGTTEVWLRTLPCASALSWLKRCLGQHFTCIPAPSQVGVRP